MFRSVFPPSGNKVTIFVEGQPVEVLEGTTVAAAVLQHGMEAFRVTPTRGEERGPFCLMGVCCECLMEIDGVPNQQSCLVKVAEGMRVRLQRGAPSFTPRGPK